MDYQGNSNKDKENRRPKREDKQIEKVVTGEVIMKKKSVGKKFREIFFGGDVKNVARYIAADVLIPALRTLIIETTTKSVERLVNGESMYPRRRHRYDYTYGPSARYDNPLAGRREPREIRDLRNPMTMLPDQPPYSRIRPRQELEEIVLKSRQDAELIVERLTDTIDKYEVASRADLLELLGFPSSFTDQNWGWTILPHVEIRQVREGYLLNLPPVEPI